MITERDKGERGKRVEVQEEEDGGRSGGRRGEEGELVGGEGRGKEDVTSSVSDPKSRRSNGMAATRSIINQPLDEDKLI